MAEPPADADMKAPVKPEQEAEAEAEAEAASKTPEMMTVGIKLLDGTKLDCVLPVSSTALQLKQLVQQQTNVAPERQRLIFRGSVLKDAQLLKDKTIVDGSVVHMVARADEPQVPPATASAAAPAPAPAPTRAAAATPGATTGGAAPPPRSDFASVFQQVFSTVQNQLQQMERLQQQQANQQGRPSAPPPGFQFGMPMPFMMPDVVPPGQRAPQAAAAPAPASAAAPAQPAATVGASVSDASSASSAPTQAAAAAATPSITATVAPMPPGMPLAALIASAHTSVTHAPRVGINPDQPGALHPLSRGVADTAQLLLQIQGSLRSIHDLLSHERHLMVPASRQAADHAMHAASMSVAHIGILMLHLACEMRGSSFGADLNQANYAPAPAGLIPPHLLALTLPSGFAGPMGPPVFVPGTAAAAPEPAAPATATATTPLSADGTATAAAEATAAPAPAAATTPAAAVPPAAGPVPFLGGMGLQIDPAVFGNALMHLQSVFSGQLAAMERMDSQQTGTDDDDDADTDEDSSGSSEDGAPQHNAGQYEQMD